MEGRTGQCRVLVVDDEQDMLVLLEKVLHRKLGCEVVRAMSADAALELLDQWLPEVVLTDIRMPGLSGMAFLKRVLLFDPTITVIIMTGYGSIEMAVQALREGAYDFFEKPFDNDKIVRSVKRALERTSLLRENRQLQSRLVLDKGQLGFVGRSRRLGQTLSLLAKLAPTDATVLIRGESGTGKELAARTLHALSPRGKRRLVTVNCPALPEHILESELFGYRKGAFTGADRDKDGLFLEADGSSILLDEIGDIPVAIQTKLLRVLQEKEIHPLGARRPVKVDVRVIASTNQDLEAKIERGEFREDLFYRLNVLTVTMPSLAEIRSDIPLLAQHFLERFAEEYGRPELEFTPEALQCLLRRPWKGNIRELQNAVNRAVLLASGPAITPSDLDDAGEEEAAAGRREGYGLHCYRHLPYKQAKEEVLRCFTTAYLEGALRQSGGNVTAAARASGMERQAFQRLMRRYNLKSSDYRQ